MPRPSILGTRILALLLALAAAGVSSVRAAVDVTFRVTVPAETPAMDSIYMAGDLQGWDPGHPDYRLADLGGNLREITLALEPGTSIAFKFTRGDWASVEKGSDGEEIPNRTHTVTGEETLELEVLRWADVQPGTLSGDVTLITVPGFLDGRRVWVYLPPGYHDEPERRYPVLYMFDGQNMFDESTSFAGEWGVDEACESLIPAELMEPIIVVAVANGEVDRIEEYSPWPDPTYGGGGGGAHLTAFVDTLKPHVDASYRTLAAAEHTGLAGSSLGGLMSLYGAYANAGVFGRIAALSPSLWWSEYALLAYAAGQPKPAAKVYLDMGTLEPGHWVDDDGNGVADAIDDLRALRDQMIAQGFVLDDDLMVVEDAGGLHNEHAWSLRFPTALQFLFPFTSTTAPDDGVSPPDALRLLPNAPNPFNPHTVLRYELPKPAEVTLRIYDAEGRRVRSLWEATLQDAGVGSVTWDGRDDGGVDLPSGIYFYRLSAGPDQAHGKMCLLR